MPPDDDDDQHFMSDAARISLTSALERAIAEEGSPFAQVQGMPDTMATVSGIIGHVNTAWANCRTDDANQRNRQRAADRLEAALQDARDRCRVATNAEKAAQLDEWRNWLSRG